MAEETILRLHKAIEALKLDPSDRDVSLAHLVGFYIGAAAVEADRDPETGLRIGVAAFVNGVSSCGKHQTVQAWADSLTVARAQRRRSQ